MNAPDDLRRAAAAASPPDRADAIRRARELLMPVGERVAPEYPVDALGPLASACGAIVERAQVQPAMAGQCLLAAASLLVQGLFNVETLAGRRPLSLFLLTLGDSGDGKSAAQGVALARVHEWQRRAAAQYAAEQAAHEQALSAMKKGDAKPETPRSPYRLMRDATVEGLRRELSTGVCAQGVFTDEAAAILSGYGMTPENRAKTAGVFSGLWDNGHLSVSRATGGRTERYGARIALHWLIQPQAASETLGDVLLSQLGFWPRYLLAWPSAQAPRQYRPWVPGESAAVRGYWHRCDELLACPLPDDADLVPVIEIEDGARDLLGRAFEWYERQARRGSLRPVKPFGLRAAEQAARVAGVLATFEGRSSVDASTMRGALKLVEYSVTTWQAVVDEGAADQGAAHALRLFEWLTARPGWRARLASIVKDGPPSTRSKSTRDRALELLAEHDLVHVAGGDAVALVPDEVAP